MCIAAPGKVVKIEGHKVTVAYPRETRVVLAGDDAISVGDHVLVQMGIIIQVLSDEDARAALAAWS